MSASHLPFAARRTPVLSAVRDEAPVPVRTSRYLAGAPGQPDANIEMLIYIIRGEVRGEAAMPGHSFIRYQRRKCPRGDNRSVLAARPNALAIGEGRSTSEGGERCSRRIEQSQNKFCPRGLPCVRKRAKDITGWSFRNRSGLFHFVGKRRGNVCACCAPHDRLSSSSWLSAPRLKSATALIAVLFPTGAASPGV